MQDCTTYFKTDTLHIEKAATDLEKSFATRGEKHTHTKSYATFFPLKYGFNTVCCKNVCPWDGGGGALKLTEMT